jgi:hypothetical protein
MEGRVALITRFHNEDAHIGRLLTGAFHQRAEPPLSDADPLAERSLAL